MSDSTFLLYAKRGSVLENWDPRTKIIASLLFGAALLIAGNWILKTIFLAVLIALWGAARLSWRVFGITLLSLSIFFISTMIYHAVLSVQPGDQLLTLSGVTLSRRGMLSGLMMCEQIAGVVLLLSLLVRTTSPILLAEALELLLNPLKKWKLPVHEAVMMFSISLRFLPLLAEEFSKIRKAQLARGGGFHRGGIGARLRGLLPMLMPLFVQSIIRSRDLAIAMESRCYEGDVGRTPIRIYRYSASDYTVQAAAAAALILSFWL